jgi:ribonuclease R
VELSNTIEGMIHVSMLPGDYFYYDSETYEMVGQATNIRYKLGQTLKVKVNATDKILRTIDFVLPKDAGYFGLDAKGEDNGKE